MREDIDIRLLDYFYFSHSEVEKTNGVVALQEEKESTDEQQKNASEPSEKH